MPKLCRKTALAQVDRLLLAHPLLPVRAMAGIAGVSPSTAQRRRTALYASGDLQPMSRHAMGIARNQERFVGAQAQPSRNGLVDGEVEAVVHIADRLTGKTFTWRRRITFRAQRHDPLEAVQALAMRAVLARWDRDPWVPPSPRGVHRHSAEEALRSDDLDSRP